MERRGLAVAVAGVLVLAGCGAQPGVPMPAAPGSIVIGSDGTSEGAVVAEIYASALTAAGIDAGTERAAGHPDDPVQAVQDGPINLMPTFTGTLLRSVDPDAATTNSHRVYAALQESLPMGVMVLDRAPAERTRALAISDPTPMRGARTIGDLRGLAPEITVGGPADQEPLLAEVAKAYSLDFKEFRATGPDSQTTIDALRTFTIQAAVVTSTDAALLPRDPSGFTVTLTQPVSAGDPDCRRECGALVADLERTDTVDSVEYISQDEVWAGYQKGFADDPELLAVGRKEAMSAYLKVHLDDPATLRAVTSAFQDAEGVREIRDEMVVNLRTLDDPQNLFDAENVVPLIAMDAATPPVRKVLDGVSAELTTRDLIELNDKVVNQHRDTAEVAAGWLSAKGFG